MKSIRLTVNGKKQRIQAYPMERLLDVLRVRVRLTGTKEGCGEGECGACAVILDGKLVNSCLIPVGQADGGRVLTIEGLASGKKLHKIQESFLKYGGAQCGICTPGMIVAALSVSQKRHLSLRQIQESLAGNLCRCTGYVRIFESVKRAMSR